MTKSGNIGIEDAWCAEMYEKMIFRFLLFEIWLIFYSNFIENGPKYHHKWQKKGNIGIKDAWYAEMYEKIIFRFLIFEIFALVS